MEPVSAAVGAIIGKFAYDFATDLLARFASGKVAGKPAQAAETLDA